MRAAEGSVEPYWNIFKFHQTQDVYDILEEYRIGSIDPQDLKNGELLADSIKDAFADDPTRDPRLQTLTDKPQNAETSASELSEFLTPNKLFYVRNHYWVPSLDEESHSIVIELEDGEEKSYTMADLKTKFKQFKVTATLQCSGNRRKHMNKGAHQTSGLPRGLGRLVTQNGVAHAFVMFWLMQVSHLMTHQRMQSTRSSWLLKRTVHRSHCTRRLIRVGMSFSHAA